MLVTNHWMLEVSMKMINELTSIHLLIAALLEDGQFSAMGSSK